MNNPSLPPGALPPSPTRGSEAPGLRTYSVPPIQGPEVHRTSYVLGLSNPRLQGAPDFLSGGTRPARASRSVVAVLPAIMPTRPTRRETRLPQIVEQTARTEPCNRRLKTLESRGFVPWSMDLMKGIRPCITRTASASASASASRASGRGCAATEAASSSLASAAAAGRSISSLRDEAASLRTRPTNATGLGVPRLNAHSFGGSMGEGTGHRPKSDIISPTPIGRGTAYSSPYVYPHVTPSLPATDSM